MHARACTPAHTHAKVVYTPICSLQRNPLARRDALGWSPDAKQMNKQGNWWLHALVHYGTDDQVGGGGLDLSWQRQPSEEEELITPRHTPTPTPTHTTHTTHQHSLHPHPETQHPAAPHPETPQVLLGHRVTGEITLFGGTPQDEIITPPLPSSWTMWFMGYGPDKELQVGA